MCTEITGVGIRECLRLILDYTMKVLGLVTLSLFCAGCQGLLPISGDTAGIPAPDPCEQIGAQMSVDQRISEGGIFASSCRASAWIASCADGYIDRAQSKEQLCFGHKGVTHAIERN